MNRYMRIAVNEARKGIKMGDGGPFGSVVVKDGRVVAKGHNEVLKRRDCTCHGEVMAIRRACKKLGTHDLSGCELYTTSEPCVMCKGAIMWSNISHVFYGCTIADAEDIGFRDNKFHSEVTDSLGRELDRDECLELFSEYRAISDKENY